MDDRHLRCRTADLAIGFAAKTQRATEARGPRFSVIIPLAPGRETRGLELLRRLRFPADRYEVVADVGPNASRNRNRSIARSSGAILAFTDDDCVVHSQWLARAQAFFEAHPGYDVVGGPQLTSRSDGFLARACGYVLTSPFGTWRTNCRFKRRQPSLAATELALTSANLFIRRRAFERHGPFDTRLWPNEETELLGRIALAGGKMAYDPGIVVFHKRRKTLAAWARQCFLYGTGRARQTRISGTLTARIGVIVPCTFLAYLALLPVLAAVHGLFWFPLALYGAANLAATAQASWASDDPRAALVLPLLFPVVHLSYALGFLVEAGRLWILRRGLREVGDDAPCTGAVPIRTEETATGPRLAVGGPR